MIPKQITFRLNDAEAKRLYQAARAERLSPHLRARNIVLEGLTLSEIETLLRDLVDAIESLSTTQALLEQRIQAMEWGMVETLSLMVANQENVSKKEALEWIWTQFRQDLES